MPSKDEISPKPKSFEYKNPAAYKELFNNKNVRKKLLYAGIVILAFMLLKGCFARHQKPAVYPRPVKMAGVVTKDVPVYIESFGTLRALNSVDIKSQVTGKIAEVRFKEGDEASKGDILFVIETGEYKAGLEKAEAALSEDVANLKLKQDTLDRNAKLFEKELLSKQDYEKCQTDVASAKAQVALDTAAVELAKINLGYCYIKTPIDGLAGKRQVDIGNIVSANSGPILVNIKTIDRLYLDFTISETDLAAVRNAMAKNKLKVEITVEGDNESPYAGELDSLDNKVDNTTGTLSLWAIVPNENRKLWSGQFVQVDLILDIKKDALMVPSEAVQLGQQGPYLFAVTQDNKADLRIVVTGPDYEGNIVIEKGVNAGEKVVVTGQMGLSPGVPLVDIAVLQKKQEEIKKGKRK